MLVPRDKIIIPTYPSVVLENPKFARNVSAVVRLASCFGIRQVYYTGSRMDVNLYGMKRLPREERMKGYREVQLIGEDRPLDYMENAVPVVVEFVDGYVPLTYFEHPKNAVYIFGPEDGGVSKGFRALAHRLIWIPSNHCLNLATAVACVLSHRRMQEQWFPERMTEYVVPDIFASDEELG